MDENIYKDGGSEDTILPEDENPFRNELKTSPNIKTSLSGTVTELGSNQAKTNFFASEEMPRGLSTAVLFSRRLAMRRWLR